MAVSDEMQALTTVFLNNDVDDFEDGWMYPNNTYTENNDLPLYVPFEQNVGVASVLFGGHARLTSKNDFEASVSSVEIHEIESQLADLISIELQYTNDYRTTWVAALSHI